MKQLASFCLLLSVLACGRASPNETSLSSVTNGSFPTTPDPGLTPGSICDQPDTYRYPEHVAYCNRAVAPSQKAFIISEYDRAFGYNIGQMNRNNFKIDHRIPLCMGGGNQMTNLWPQHNTVYQITDPLEEGLCRLLARGNMRQAEAVSLILEVKLDLSLAPDLLRRVSE